MQKNKTRKVCAALLAPLLLTGCKTTVADYQMAPIDSQQTNTEDESIISGAGEMENSIRTADLLFSDDGQNHIFSPLSLNMSLGLLQEGANGETKEAISNYLANPRYGDFARPYLSFVDDLNQTAEPDPYDMGGYDTVLRIANGIWTNQNLCTLNSEYQSAVSSSYRANISSYDFADASGLAGEINSWCNELTNGMISDPISSDMIEENSAAILVNTLYFEAPWSQPWQLENQTSEFYAASGTQMTTYLISSSASIYFENEHATAFGYPYYNGLYFIGILPKEEGSFSLESLDIPSLLEAGTTEFSSLLTLMPKLDYECQMELTQVFPECGLSPMLGSNADYSIMGENLTVESVAQVVRIQLDENGTRAAAVTDTMMCVTSMPDDELPIYEVYLNRPYAYLIYDMQNEQILFVGKVNSVE